MRDPRRPPNHPHAERQDDDHDRGLSHDLATLLQRRQMLGLIASVSALPFLGCGEGDGTSRAETDAGQSVAQDAGQSAPDASGPANDAGRRIDDAGSAASDAGSAASDAGSAASDAGRGNEDASTPPEGCSTIPEETAGPFPGDGSNGANALTTSGVVRSDIRSSFGGMTGTAAGVPLIVRLTLVNSNAACAPLAGHAIYVWHCDRESEYSLYTISNQNYLRGVQETDEDGVVTFTTIFPGCYPGRWPHMHFEVFPSLARATSSASKLKTSQLALPDAACREVYATSEYASSRPNLAGTSFTSDGVFRGGGASQLATVSGSLGGGLVASLVVGISR